MATCRFFSFPFFILNVVCIFCFVKPDIEELCERFYKEVAGTR